MASSDAAISPERLERVDRARSLWRESDRLTKRARELHEEAAAVERAAERMNRMAAAIADSRDDELVEEALRVV